LPASVSSLLVGGLIVSFFVFIFDLKRSDLDLFRGHFLNRDCISTFKIRVNPDFL
jgi:hypothetical protein